MTKTLKNIGSLVSIIRSRCEAYSGMWAVQLHYSVIYNSTSTLSGFPDKNIPVYRGNTKGC